MLVDLHDMLKPNQKIAVAVSGGCDSMCLLHFLFKNLRKYRIQVLAINVEHGIRGQSSIDDSLFVKKYCEDNGIKLLSYSVKALDFAKENKLSVEQAARILRYQCFKRAIALGECDKVATAHHRDDNVETVLFNLFRGTGLKGLTGIVKEREDNVIRPFLSVDREEIEKYAKENNLPFVTDETNLSDDYTRNCIRHNIIPKIKELFPELNGSIERLSNIAYQDDEFINSIAQNQINVKESGVEILLPCSSAVLSRAVIVALKAMGIRKDWEKSHIDQVIALSTQENGAMLSLPKEITAIKEYDKIVFFNKVSKELKEQAFSIGQFELCGKRIEVKEVEKSQIDLRSGLYIDFDKIPPTAVFRTRREGDVFKKFGGGSKALGDYFTDKKIPLRERDEIILLADGNNVLAIFGLAISETLKVENTSKRVLQLKASDKIC